jgi:beta-phosphoglucomutase-like phosphatase (HAD superfamily)
MAPDPGDDLMTWVPAAVVFDNEDSLTGLRSAQAAGLRTVGVPTLRHDSFPADLVVSSLRDERLLAWVGRWA